MIIYNSISSYTQNLPVNIFYHNIAKYTTKRILKSFKALETFPAPHPQQHCQMP